MASDKTRVGRKAASGGGLSPGVVLSEIRLGHHTGEYVACSEGISFQSGLKGLHRRIYRTLLFAWADIQALDLVHDDHHSVEDGGPQHSILRVRTKSGGRQLFRLSASVARARNILSPYWPVPGSA
jgi:hypothetical protein